MESLKPTAPCPAGPFPRPDPPEKCQLCRPPRRTGTDTGKLPPAVIPVPIISPEHLGLFASRVRLLDARPGSGGRAAYAKEHLAEALHADLDTKLAAPAPWPAQGGRHPLPELSSWGRTLGEWGIGPKDAVVIYDDAGGAKAAARVWWMLRAVGHQWVAVLDGGWGGAKEAGFPITDKVPLVRPKAAYPVGNKWKLPLATLELVRTYTRDRTFRILDVRSEERFTGRHEPIDTRAGHIDSAVNLPHTDLLNVRGRFRSRSELRARFRDVLENVPAEATIVHCDSGVSACKAILAMELAGMMGAHLYVGGWSEWSRNRAIR